MRLNPCVIAGLSIFSGPPSYVSSCENSPLVGAAGVGSVFMAQQHQQRVRFAQAAAAQSNSETEEKNG